MRLIALIVALLVLPVTAVAQTVGVRALRLVYVTYQENRTHAWPDLAARSTQILQGVNVSYGEMSYGKLQFSERHFGYFDTAVSLSASLSCEGFYNNVRKAVTSLLPIGVPGEITVFVYPPGTPCYPTTIGQIHMTVDEWPHELGHALGLPHAQRLSRSSTGNTASEYGDLYDEMGNHTWGDPYHHFKPYVKRQLGWFDASLRMDLITTPQTVTLVPYESMAPGLKAVNVRVPGAVGFGSYLEYRASARIPGVPLRDATYHLDLDTQTSAELWVLPLNQPITENGVTYTLLTMTPSAATVRIGFASSVPSPRSGGRPILKES